MPQPRFFPPMTFEVYQAYMNFWYAQTQAQMQVGQVPYPAPPPTTFAQPSTQQGVKLSKLVKEVRLLSCETFSGSVDAIVAKNWMEKITNIMIDMELEDNLKLKVATRLMDKIATTWWENLILRTIVPIVDAPFCPSYCVRFNVCWALGPFMSRFEFKALNLVRLFSFVFYRVFEACRV